MSVKLFEIREELKDLEKEKGLPDTKEEGQRLRGELQQLLDARD